MQGFIKLHRKMIEWEWYKDANTMRLFLHLLLKATHKEIKIENQLIKVGEVKTGRNILAKELNISEQQVRTSLSKLQTTNEITVKSFVKFSIITIVNWQQYQTEQPTNQPTERQSSINIQTNKQPTNQPTSNQQNNQQNNQLKNTPALICKQNGNQQNNQQNNHKQEYSSSSSVNTTTTTYINEKNENCFYGEFNNVYLTFHQYSKLKTMILNDVALNEIINALSSEIESGSKKYKKYEPEFPNAHYVHLKNFWKYRSYTGINNTAKSTAAQTTIVKGYNFGY